MSKGNQPINLDVMFDARIEERSELWTVFYRDGVIDSDEQRLLAWQTQNDDRTGAANTRRRVETSRDG